MFQPPRTRRWECNIYIYDPLKGMIATEVKTVIYNFTTIAVKCIFSCTNWHHLSIKIPCCRCRHLYNVCAWNLLLSFSLQRHLPRSHQAILLDMKDLCFESKTSLNKHRRKPGYLCFWQFFGFCSPWPYRRQWIIIKLRTTFCECNTWIFIWWSLWVMERDDRKPLYSLRGMDKNLEIESWR